MENKESTAVVIAAVLSAIAIITKVLDLLSSWLKYKTQLVQARATTAPKDSPLTKPSFRAFLKLLAPLWPAFPGMLIFLFTLLWYAWNPRQVTTGAIANIAICVGGLFFLAAFVIAAIVFQIIFPPTPRRTA
jgi:hypothetical protein